MTRRFTGRSLAPVVAEGLEGQLDAGGERDELVGARADRGLLVGLLAHLLDVLLGHDPARAGGGGAVEGHEVGPLLLQHEAGPVGRDHLDLLHLVLEQLAARALVPLERELHVVRGDRIAVVEARVLPDHELVGEAVLGDGPGLGQARGHDVAGHRLHERVVERVEDHERGDQGFGLAGVEPPRDQGHVQAQGHGAVRRDRAGGAGTEQRREDEEQDCESTHRSPPGKVDRWREGTTTEIPRRGISGPLTMGE